jgi:WD40 repeat protein
MVRRTPNGKWGEPEHLPEPINSDGSEFCASAARNGTLYFSSTRDAPPGAIRAFRARNVDGKWQTPENLSTTMGGKPEDPYLDLDVMVDPDERFVLIGSYGRPDGFGHFDVYVSWNQSGTWSPPHHLPAPFNTPTRDYAPHISPDGKYIFFSSERGFTAANVTRRFASYRDLTTRLRSTVNGSGNIYQIDAAMLDSLGH